MREQLVILDDLISPYLNPYDKEGLEEKALMIRAQGEEIRSSKQALTVDEARAMLSWLPPRVEQLPEVLRTVVFDTMREMLHDSEPLLEQLAKEQARPGEVLMRLFESLAAEPNLHLGLPQPLKRIWCWRGLMQPGVKLTTDLEALVFLSTLQMTDKDGYLLQQDWASVWKTLTSSPRYAPPFRSDLDHLEIGKLYFIQALTNEQRGQHLLIPSRQPRLTRFPHPGSPIQDVDGKHRFILTTQQEYTDLGAQLRAWAESTKGESLRKVDLQVRRIERRRWEILPAYNQFTLTGDRGSSALSRTNIHGGAYCHEGRELTVYSYDSNDMDVTEPTRVQANVVWADKPPAELRRLNVLWDGAFQLPRSGEMFFVNPLQGRRPSASVKVPAELAGQEVVLTLAADRDGGHGRMFLFWFHRKVKETDKRR